MPEVPPEFARFVQRLGRFLGILEEYFESATDRFRLEAAVRMLDLADRLRLGEVDPARHTALTMLEGAVERANVRARGLDS